MIAAVKTDVKQQETKKTGTFSQNLKCNIKETIISDLILVGIPSSLILSIKKRG